MTFSIPDQYRSFLPRFYKLAAVAVLSNMMVPLAGLCDAAFLGHLDNINYLAGVILGGLLFDYIYRILKFLRNSTNTLTANAVGQDDETAVLVAGLRCGLIALAIAGVILLLQYPIHQFGFAVLSGSGDVKGAGLEYFNARIWGAPAVLLNFVLIGWFLGREMNGIVLLMSLIGNGTNVLFDYLMIWQWGWESTGAGVATALSQYLALLVGLVAVALGMQWQLLRPAWAQVMDRQGLMSAVVLKGNILVRFLALISAYAIFTNLSASFGVGTLAENGLLLQIALLSQFTVQGVGMTAQTLIGNFKGKGQTAQMLPVLGVALVTGLAIALTFALSAVFFPEAIFKLLTSHTEVSQAMQQSVGWLVPLLSLTAAAFMLESYFTGIKDGATLRNGAILGFAVGFMPLTLLAMTRQSEYLLWSALTAYMGVLLAFLTYRLVKTHQLLVADGDAVSADPAQTAV
ncbi:guanitoxin biosynthesis MATE family efflux transporter GntT [Leptolyngbya sp. BC1307]|uniref:guanitoxin biosynthesis MATE family efflux transporter GntT n=1 Tax=Leptolyngbya sp. BC1307 TaxID=2029589 RepID=UPI000EFD5A60|nr:guanitoxin biosynthesis MATE family efflux transporter GntT [Leptolyngbya sp. BC1307]